MASWIAGTWRSVAWVSKWRMDNLMALLAIRRFHPKAGQGRRLDYIFVEAAWAERVIEARVLPWAKGSDHAPLFVEIS
jgi:endonuclease/exonuclease/phosphatase (EEP) superfamily protein YafD